jgi:hypothetical protein
MIGVREIQVECNLSAKAQDQLDDQAVARLGLYSTDAVYAAQKTSQFIFADITEDIAADFFTVEWLDELPDHDLAQTLYATIEDYMLDLQMYIDDDMVQKVLEALVSKTIIFYVGQLLDRAEEHNSGLDSVFADNQRALQHINGDIGLIAEYFDSVAEEDFPLLARVIETEFAFFVSMKL